MRLGIPGISAASIYPIQRFGRTVSIFLVLIWILSFLTLGIAVSVYVQALFDQVGRVTLPESPIAPVTYLSGLLAFVLISFLSRLHRLKIALGGAIVGTIAAPMIFELPFDLMVMGRTYAPAPVVQFTLLFFLPLFLWEILSFAPLTLSPATNLSRYTLFSVAAMFLVFGIWAWYGFPYPTSPIPLALNALSKSLSFMTVVTLFLPQKGITTNPDMGLFTSHVSHETTVKEK